MFSTRPEGVAMVSKATEPTARMLIISVASRWALVAGLCRRCLRLATSGQRLLQILSQYQTESLFCAGGNLVPLSQDRVCQRRSTIAGTRLRRGAHRGLHYLGRVLGVFHQHGDNLVHRD